MSLAYQNVRRGLHKAMSVIYTQHLKRKDEGWLLSQRWLDVQVGRKRLRSTNSLATSYYDQYIHSTQWSDEMR